MRRTIASEIVTQRHNNMYPYGKKNFCKYSIEDTGFGDLLCLEGYSGRYFYSSKHAVDAAMQRFSASFKNGNYLCLNDLYNELRITPSHFGHQYGWAPSDGWYDYENGIDFECNFIYDRIFDRPIYIIDIYTYPMECWQEV